MISYYNGYEVYYIKRRMRQMHRKIMADNIGRELTSSELVHHKDGNRTNNDLSNLELMTRRTHQAYHLPRHPENKPKLCRKCLKMVNPQYYSRDKVGRLRSTCKPCRAKQQIEYMRLKKLTT